MLRSAHLERAQSQIPASIVYVSERYDFDKSLADGLDLIRAGTFRAPWIILRSRITVCEINEPLVRARLLRTVLTVGAARLSARLRREPVSVVCYAIENLDPYRHRATSGSMLEVRKAAIRSRLDRLMARWVAGEVDRIAFGTPGSRDLYLSSLGSRLRGAQMITIPALPARCDCPSGAKDPQHALFLGAFEPRKGFDLVMSAWPAAQAAVPAASLTLIGKGTLEAQARVFADGHPRVDLDIDPPRVRVHQALRTASAVILLSQRGENWREQVGLPLVEALAHGCRVLTTNESGLASWLAEHGHRVLDPAEPPAAIARAIAEELVSERDPWSVIADLPAIDGRLAADAWLFKRDEPAVPGSHGLAKDASVQMNGNDGGAPSSAAAIPVADEHRIQRRARGLLNRTERRRLIRKAYERGRGRMRGQRGAQIARGAKLTGPGTYLLGHGSRIKEDARIFVAEGATLQLGAGAAIGIRNIINVACSVTIGDRSRLSWDCQVLDTDFHEVFNIDGKVRPKTQSVRIGDHVLIGTGAIILKGVTIGDGAVVAAGSVVSRDVAAGTIVAGNPAKPVGTAVGWK